MKKILVTGAKDFLGHSGNQKINLYFQKVKQFFGHQPAVYLDEGIKRTAQWYQQHIASL